MRATRLPRVSFVHDPIAWATATDAGNRSMRNGGRTAWSAEDYRAALTLYARLVPVAPSGFCELCREPAGEGSALCPACKEAR